MLLLLVLLEGTCWCVVALVVVVVVFVVMVVIVVCGREGGRGCSYVFFFVFVCIYLCLSVVCPGENTVSFLVNSECV